MLTTIMLIGAIVSILSGVDTLAQRVFPTLPRQSTTNTTKVVVNPTPQNLTASPRPGRIIVVSTPTPTPVIPLGRQLEDALSINSSTAQSNALLEVAQHAVLLGDYRTAIRAAAATSWPSNQGENLAFVVRCAIEDGFYDVASSAADRVESSSQRDSLKLEVIKATKEATSTEETTPISVDRESMACFDTE